MEHEVKPRVLRLIHGTPAEVEAQLHELSETYAVTGFVWHQISDRVLVTAQCVLASELRKMQIANIQGPPGRGH
jgi:TolB-like protein